MYTSGRSFITKNLRILDNSNNEEYTLNTTTRVATLEERV